MSKQRFVPDGWHTITPRVFVRDVEGLVGFLKRVFDATGEYREDAPSVLTIGDSRLMISGLEARAEMRAFLYVYVPDVDAVYEKAIAAGARSLEAPLDLPYGDRRCMLADAWGNTWQIATHSGRFA